MTANQVKDLHQLLGKEVRTLCAWSGIAVGTIGVIDEIYDDGQAIMIAWCEQETKDAYTAYRGLRVGKQKLLRDGFKGEQELKFLEIL